MENHREGHCAEKHRESRSCAKAVVGLGNPGRTYTRTRHNAGARVVALMWRKLSSGPAVRRSYAVWKSTELKGIMVYVVRPRSYMNLSGPAVKKFMDSQGIAPEELLVVHDDLDLPLGTLRFRRNGSSGGHRGVASLIEALGSRRFNRLKIGIGRPGQNGPDVVEFVLSDPSVQEAPVLAAAEERAAEAAWLWVTEGIEYCMNTFNRPALSAEEGKP